jgi:hypothetical protein
MGSIFPQASRSLAMFLLGQGATFGIGLLMYPRINSMLPPPSPPFIFLPPPWAPGEEAADVGTGDGVNNGPPEGDDDASAPNHGRPTVPAPHGATGAGANGEGNAPQQPATSGTGGQQAEIGARPQAAPAAAAARGAAQEPPVPGVEEERRGPRLPERRGAQRPQRQLPLQVPDVLGGGVAFQLPQAPLTPHLREQERFVAGAGEDVEEGAGGIVGGDGPGPAPPRTPEPATPGATGDGSAAVAAGEDDGTPAAH